MPKMTGAPSPLLRHSPPGGRCPPSTRNLRRRRARDAQGLRPSPQTAETTPVPLDVRHRRWWRHRLPQAAAAAVVANSTRRSSKNKKHGDIKTSLVLRMFRTSTDRLSVIALTHGRFRRMRGCGRLDEDRHGQDHSATYMPAGGRTTILDMSDV